MHAPHRALIVVDVQNDFCEGGSLGVHGGATAVADAVTTLLPHYRIAVATRDYHIDPGDHFSGQSRFRRQLAAALPRRHRGRVVPSAVQHRDGGRSVLQGQYSAAYSGFEGTARTARRRWLIGSRPARSPRSTSSASPPITVSAPRHWTRSPLVWPPACC